MGLDGRDNGNLILHFNIGSKEWSGKGVNLLRIMLLIFTVINNI